MGAGKFVADPGELSRLRHVRAREEKFRLESLDRGTRFRILSASRRRYEVEIRDPRAPVNRCSCPDFAVNLLGTCKHIHLALARLRRRASRRSGALVYLSRRESPRVALHAFGRLSGRKLIFAREFFRPDGFLAAGDSDALERLMAAARSAGIEVGRDVLEHVAAQRAKAEWQTAVARLEPQIRGDSLISVPLYPYQTEGVGFLLRRGRAVLADEMGLGKTAQAIAAAWLLVRKGHVRRTLIVCPASLKHQWEREIRRFTGAEAGLVAGPPRLRHDLYRSGPSFLISNYEQIYRDREFLQDSGTRWDLVILDEAQRIKNWRAKTSDAVKDLRPRSRFAFVLTGTPFENNIEELFSVCQFVDPSILGPLWKFYDRYFRLDEKGHALGYHNLDELRNRIAPAFLRRTKEQVRLQLPAKIVNTYYVEMTPAQRETHDSWMQQVGRLLAILQRRPLLPKERERMMMYLLMARRSCDDSSLGNGEPSSSPKIKELGRILEELVQDGGRKAIVFSEWVDMLDLARSTLKRLRIGHVYLHGAVPSSRRGALVDRFREDPSCRVFLSSEAGGLGLNLQAATVVINLDLPWNPARLEQRAGRAHRIGQREPVQVVNLVSEKSIEHRIEKLLEGKRELFDAVFGDDPKRTEIPLPSQAGPAQELVRQLVDEKEWREGGGRVAPDKIERPRTLEEAMVSALGSVRHEILHLPAPQDGVSTLVGVDRPAPEHQERVAQAASAIGEPVPRVVSREVLSVVRALSRKPVPAEGGVDRALSAARCLRKAGFGSEAVAHVGRAVLRALSELLERHGLPAPAPNLIPLAIRRDLIPRNAAPRPLLERAIAVVGWTGCSELSGGLDDATADELMAEGQQVLAELESSRPG